MTASSTASTQLASRTLWGVITAMASIGAFDVDPDGPAARRVRKAARELSNRLGKRADQDTNTIAPRPALNRIRSGQT